MLDIKKYNTCKKCFLLTKTMVKKFKKNDKK